MSDVHDGMLWERDFLQDPVISSHAGDFGRNLAFSFCGDGVNPFMHKNYSMWPFALACLNLPGHVRMTLPALWVPFIVPPYGPNHGEASDFQPFLEIITDELSFLYHDGLVEVKDASWRYV